MNEVPAMRRSARQVLASVATLALLVLAGAAPATVRANGFTPQADTWVATSGTPTGSTAGSSCAHPGFVVDGVQDETEIGYAIADVLPGGTVHLCAGTYHVTTGQGYGKSFTLAGAGRDATVIVGTATFNASDEYVSGGSEFLWTVGTPHDDLTLSLRDLTIRNFYGSNFGGYGALYGEDYMLDRVRMDHNGSLAGQSGAITGGNVTVRNSIFSENVSSDGGGAISSGRFVASYSTFSDNVASGDGGAIIASDLTIERSTFLRNKAMANGGAFTGTGVVTIKKSDFIDNTAGSQAGAGFTYGGSTVTIEGARFRGNVADASHGGALRLYESTAIIKYSSFTGNRAGQSGGAFDAYQGSLKVISSRFYSNTADSGGAFVSWEQNSLVVFRSLFLRNVALVDGGAILEHGGLVAPQIRFNIFERNRSLQGAGGALTANAGDVLGGDGPNLLGIHNNTFRYNKSFLGSTIQINQCEATSAESRHVITSHNRILRKQVDAIGPRVRFTTVTCIGPG